MSRTLSLVTALAGAALGAIPSAWAGQAPGSPDDPDVPISHRDRVYAAEQFSNTVSVVDPADNRLLGVIRLGDPEPGNLSPLYRGQLLVHGMGFSPDDHTLAVVSIGSNSVTFIDTATNAVKHTTYVGRSPHEAFFTRDGSEVWVTVRGEDYVAVLDGHSFEEKARIKVPAGPGMTIFSPDGKYGYVCSSFNPETEVISVAGHQIVGRVAQASPFCPDIAATPDGSQVWFTLKDVGKVQVFDARPPFALLKTIDTLTNTVIATVPIGQAPQAVVYVPDAVPEGAAGTENLQLLGIAGAAAHLTLAPAGNAGGPAATSITLFDQGLSQVLQAAVIGLEAKQPNALALAARPDGSGPIEPLAAFMTNPAGSAIVNAVGPIRQIVRSRAKADRRYLVIVPGGPGQFGKPVQVQVD